MRITSTQPLGTIERDDNRVPASGLGLFLRESDSGQDWGRLARACNQLSQTTVAARWMAPRKLRAVLS